MFLFEIINILLIVVLVDERRLVCALCVCVCVCVAMVTKAAKIKVLFAEMYVNVVFVIRCLYSAVSLTLKNNAL